MHKKAFLGIRMVIKLILLWAVVIFGLKFTQLDKRILIDKSRLISGANFVRSEPCSVSVNFAIARFVPSA